jgi:hypothetical protein
MRESRFQRNLIKELKEKYPDSIIKKVDPPPQGIPDVWIFHTNGKYAALECKKSEHERRQPNQEYYVNKINKMAFSRFIFPENKEEVLNELQRALESGR